MIISKLTRRGRAKGLEALRQAKARNDARTALRDFLEGLDGDDRLRRLAAINDVSSDELASAEGPLNTACRLYAKGGRLAPGVDRAAPKQAAEAVFKTAEQAA